MCSQACCDSMPVRRLVPLVFMHGVMRARTGKPVWKVGRTGKEGSGWNRERKGGDRWIGTERGSTCHFVSPFLDPRPNMGQHGFAPVFCSTDPSCSIVAAGAFPQVRG